MPTKYASYGVTVLVSFSFTAMAQTASIKDIPADGESTTITVQKNVSKLSSSTQDILEGSAEIVGDPNVLQKSARESWKKACEDWKKEVKEMNKENQVLILNCYSTKNSPKCESEGGSQTVCRSIATYKIRLKLQQ